MIGREETETKEYEEQEKGCCRRQDKESCERTEWEKHRHIGFAIHRTQNMIDAVMRVRREENMGCITQVQHWIIRFMDHNQNRDIYQKDLEEEFHVSRATISSTLQVMEKNGLITRTSVKQDARLKRIQLTEKARQFNQQAKKTIEELETQMKQGFSEEELDQLYALLKRIQDNLEHM